MPALNFFRRFAGAVERREKRQTIRRSLARPIREGDELALYTGQRTRWCRLLGRATCIRVVDVELYEGGPIVGGVHVEPDTFARSDGFRDYREMVQWFKNTYGLPNGCGGAFRGVLIQWA